MSDPRDEDSAPTACQGTKAPQPGSQPGSQPWLHDLVLTLSAPTQAWSGSDGQVRPGGAHGVMHADRRFLSELVLTVDGEEPSPVAHHDRGGDRHVFVAVARRLGDPGPDPTVRITRYRSVTPGRLRERITVSSSAAAPVAPRLELAVAADLAAMDAVKAGEVPPPVPADGSGSADGVEVTWARDGFRGTVRAAGATIEQDPDGRVRLVWAFDVAARDEASCELLVTADDDRAVVTAPRRPAGWSDLRVTSDDRRLGPVLDTALADLRLLRLAPVGQADEEFVAAGAPWFLTLFGRDSLWVARMLMPVSTRLAGSTLRVLASRQGVRDDAATAEQPGKILHELRSTGLSPGDTDGGDDRSLPPVYYGTIDATPLWALTLHEAWQWGLDSDQVEQLLPTLRRALDWMVDHGDADGDHLLEYRDDSGSGLSNQGWKDSGDAVRRLDGSLASAPVALCEVQGYAYAAATRGAALLEAYGVSGTDRWRSWAERLQAEFRSRFWVEDASGAFPAIALDGEKNPVGTLTSNIGHLLGTGLLTPEEVDAIARRLVGPDLLSGFGIRTLSSDAAGYSPTGYHVGTVWPHDTAISLMGLALEGRPEVAPVGEALLSALHAFHGRPPELFAGDASTEHPTPVPYPAACRPQAWAAASAVALVTSLTGLHVDVPAGTLEAHPVRPWPLGNTRVTGLGPRERPLSLDVDVDGTCRLGG